MESQYAWPNLDVAVVGGGPAGLAAALALRRVRPDLRLKVFEGSPAYAPQGAGVSIAVNGARALEAIDPRLLHGLLHDAALSSGMFTYSDTSGDRMPWVSGSSPLDSLQRHGISGGMVPWNSIRTVLYGGLPEGVVEFGCKVLSCSEAAAPPGPGAPGSCPTASAAEPERLASPRGIAGSDEADGEACGALTARRVTFRWTPGAGVSLHPPLSDGTAPAFQGSVRWLGNIMQAELDDGSVPLPAALDARTNPFAPTSLHAWLPVSPDQPLRGPPPRGLYLYAAGRDAAGRGGARFVWSLYAPVAALEAAGERFPQQAAAEAGAGAREEGAEGGSKGAGDGGGGGDEGGGFSVHQSGRRGGRALQRALSSSPHLPADVRAMLAATPAERVMEFGLYTHPAESYRKGAWACGRLLLLGDAAHAGRPDGQGANLALEDAAALGACVAAHGLGPQAFAAWEEARLERVRDILTDRTTDGARRMALIAAASFGPLWSPAELAAPGGPLPAGVAEEVSRLVAVGDVGAAREAVIKWSRGVVREIVERQVAGQAIPETVPPPPGAYRFR